MSEAQEAARAALKSIQVTWASHLASAFFVAGAMFFMAHNNFVPPSAGGAAPYWWLLIAAPAVPAWLLIRHMREREAAYARTQAEPQELMRWYFFSWALADIPVLIGAPMGLFTGNMAYLGFGLLVTLGLAALARPVKQT